MYAFARKGIEHHGQGGHQGLAFAGLHLGNFALVQHHAAHQLHIIVPHAQHAARSLAHQGKNFGQQGVQALALLLYRCFVLDDAGGQIRVLQGAHLLFQSVDALHLRPQPTQISFVFAAEYLFEKKAEHGVSSRWRDAQRPRPKPARRRPAALKPGGSPLK